MTSEQLKQTVEEDPKLHLEYHPEARQEQTGVKDAMPVRIVITLHKLFCTNDFGGWAREDLGYFFLCETNTWPPKGGGYIWLFYF